MPSSGFLFRPSLPKGAMVAGGNRLSPTESIVNKNQNNFHIAVGLGNCMGFGQLFNKIILIFMIYNLLTKVKNRVTIKTEKARPQNGHAPICF